MQKFNENATIEIEDKTYTLRELKIIFESYQYLSICKNCKQREKCTKEAFNEYLDDDNFIDFWEPYEECKICKKGFTLEMENEIKESRIYFDMQKIEAFFKEIYLYSNDTFKSILRELKADKTKTYFMKFKQIFNQRLLIKSLRTNLSDIMIIGDKKINKMILDLLYVFDKSVAAPRNPNSFVE